MERLFLPLLSSCFSHLSPVSVDGGLGTITLSLLTLVSSPRRLVPKCRPACGHPNSAPPAAPWVDHCSVSSRTLLFQLRLGVTIRMISTLQKGCIFKFCGFPTLTLGNLNMVSGVSVVSSVFFGQAWSVNH